MQLFLESVSIALSAIWANKMRSFLTVLGNIVAVASIIAVVSLIQGLNGKVTELITSELGVDTFRVERSGITRSADEEDQMRNNPRVTMDDERAIRRYATTTVRALMAQDDNGAQVTYRDHIIDSVRITGVTSQYVDFPTYTIERGRLITPVEVERNRQLIVIGWDVADQLFGNQDPLDKVIKVNGVNFRVVGVNEKKGSIFGQSQDNFGVIPLGAYQRLFGARLWLSLIVKPRQPELMQAAMDETTVAMRIGRRLKPKDKDNFGLISSQSALDFYHSITNNIFAVLVGVVALSLVVGGIVIMNIMLMVVSERTSEIGLRKALGARRRDITWQILTESITLSVVGGIVGTGIGFGVAMLLSKVTPLPAAVEPWSVAAGISITAIVGLFFGLYPAMRAARLDPIEALRRE
jgi:putative ABC transport system permease protein